MKTQTYAKNCINTIFASAQLHKYEIEFAVRENRTQFTCQEKLNAFRRRLSRRQGASIKR